MEQQVEISKLQETIVALEQEQDNQEKKLNEKEKEMAEEKEIHNAIGQVSH